LRKKQWARFSSMGRNIQRKNGGEFEFLFYKGKPYSLFYFFPNFREDICATKNYQQKFPSGWIFFEEPNSRGSTVDHIEICIGEISGIRFHSINHVDHSPI
jgi:hypothetical protein